MRPVSEFSCVEVQARSGALAELAAAEAFAAGAVGLEEREGEGSVTLLLYVPVEFTDAVVRSLGRLRNDGPTGIRVAAPRPVPAIDWSERWKVGLEATVVSDRLIVRPPFAEPNPSPGWVEVVIEPGQAFGTGGHESTRLALEWIDLLAAELTPGSRLLDVGTGSGVLSLAALALAPCRAVAFDLDPLAAAAARSNARINDLADRLLVFTGPLSALSTEPFDLVVANLLSRELLPILGSIAAATRRDGRAVFSGLLASECDRVRRGLAAFGLRVEGVRERVDASGERWVGLVTRRRSGLASS